MKKIFTLLAVIAALVDCAAIAEAQQPKKVPLMGYLAGGTGRGSPNAEALRQGLRDLRYVEGQNIAIEYRGAEGNNDGFPASLKSWFEARLISSLPPEARQ